MKRITALVMVLALFLVFVACSPDAAPDEAPGETEGGLNEVTFTATEYAYEGPDTFPGGWTRLTLDNQGELAHDLLPVLLAEGKTAEDVLAALEAEGPPEWATLYGGTTAQPGESSSFVVNLPPGEYVLFSFGQSEDGPPDAAQGMIATVTVTEAEGEVDAAALPEEDATVNLVDYAFAVEGAVEAGEQLLRVSNTGEEMHELVIFRLNEGVTFEQFQEMLMSEEEPEGPPPFTQVGGTFMSPGVETYWPVEFEPGNHVFICFLPSPANEMTPHFALGMVQEVVVAAP